MTGRDATSTRDTSLEPSHAVTCGRIRTWFGEETADKQEARFCSVRVPAGILTTRAPSSEGGRDEGVAGASERRGSWCVCRFPVRRS